MRLNQINRESEQEEKEDEVEKEEEEEEEEEVQKRTSKNRKRRETEEEEETEEKEEYEYEDPHRKKMIKGPKFEKDNGKRLIKIPNFQPTPYIDKNRTLLKIMVAIVVIFISLLIIVNVAVAIVKLRKKKNIKKVRFMNDEIKILNDLDIMRFSKLKDDLRIKLNNENIKILIISYCTEGTINLNKFYEENINQKTYINPDSSLTHIHISIGFSDGCVDEIIKHLSSALEHISSSSFLHVHIMNADNFTLETFSIIMNMIHKINNNTEIIMYNANKAREDFKIREDKNYSISILKIN